MRHRRHLAPELEAKPTPSIKAMKMDSEWSGVAFVCDCSDATQQEVRVKIQPIAWWLLLLLLLLLQRVV